MIHFTRQRSLFDQSILVSLIFEEALIDSQYVQGEENLPSEENMMLCASCKKILYQLIKTMSKSLGVDGFDTAYKLKTLLDRMDTGGNLKIMQSFLLNNMERIEELIPHKAHRYYRNSLFKVNFLKAVSLYKPVPDEARPAQQAKK